MQIIVDLAELAKQIIQEKGLQPEFSKDELQQLSQINNPAPLPSKYVDLRSLLWCSIDNNDKVAPVGHFALALSNYTHSTVLNRRFPDLISQRQYKAFLRGEKPPYTLEELYSLAAHCTRQEDAAMKVERQVNKSAAAALLSSQIGSSFKGIITGASDKGTWVRIFQPAVEVKIIRGFERLNIGDKVSVRLKYVDISKGFIDFVFIEMG